MGRGNRLVLMYPFWNAAREAVPLNTHLRTAVRGASVLIVLILVAVLVVWLLVDTDRIRERLAAGIEAELGMEVRIGEPPRFGLMPGASVTLEDLELSRKGQVVATVESLRVRLALFSVLTGKFDPLELHVERPELDVDRVRASLFDNENAGRQTPERSDLSLRRLRVSDARLSYGASGTESRWLFEHCDVDLRHIRYGGRVTKRVSGNFSAEGDMDCAGVSRDRLAVRDLSIRVEGEEGLFELDPIKATLFEGEVAGRVEADFSSRPPGIRMEGGITGMEIGAFVETLEPDQTATGEVDFELSLDANGSSWPAIRKSAAGMFSLGSDGLTIDGYDLDEELDDYAETQRFNLIDVGAVFLAGPVGLAASRGYAFTGLLQGSGGRTTIDRMVSEWSVEGGVARADDVAFRTAENRLALAGALDFGESRFEDMRVAVLDGEGCAVVEQRLTGAFRDPEIEQPAFLLTVAGPLLELIERGVAAVTDSDCEVFYSGSLAHP